jgi:hypothetical protein
MKMFFCRLALAVLLVLSPTAFAKGKSHAAKSSSHSGHVAVRGYSTKRGTHVEPHHRSAPNRTQRDNWSAKGNVNPDTGKRGTKAAQK